MLEIVIEEHDESPLTLVILSPRPMRIILGNSRTWETSTSDFDKPFPCNSCRALLMNLSLTRIPAPLSRTSFFTRSITLLDMYLSGSHGKNWQRPTGAGWSPNLHIRCTRKPPPSSSQFHYLREEEPAAKKRLYNLPVVNYQKNQSKVKKPTYLRFKVWLLPTPGSLRLSASKIVGSGRCHSEKANMRMVS